MRVALFAALAAALLAALLLALAEHPDPRRNLSRGA